MNRLPKNKSFRPVRSNYAREVSYARRRAITVIVLIVALSSAVYAFWGGGSSEDPVVLPTIGNDSAYKEKPEDPGGIDIPHQDVLVYEQLEDVKRESEKERLLPPPEEPKESPKEEPQAEGEAVKPLPSIEEGKAVIVPPKAKAVKAPEPVKTVPKKAVVSNAVEEPQKLIAPTSKVAPTPAPKKAISKPKPKLVPTKETVKDEPSLDNVLERIQKKQTVTSVASGGFVVQLASVRDEAKANKVARLFETKYAKELGGASLHVKRADLGSRGIFYRVQTDPFSRDDASRLCTALKVLKVGCFLVRQ